MVDDGNTSNIVFVKDKALDGEVSATFAYLDGIDKYTHKCKANCIKQFEPPLAASYALTLSVALLSQYILLCAVGK